MDTKFGIVGLGKMGSAFARRLLDQHCEVAVWDRNAQHVSSIDGASHCASLASLISSVDVIIVSLWGDDASREVTQSQIIPAMRLSQLLIEMSTLSPAMYETLEQAAKQRNVDFVAAPILGNPDVVRDGAATVLVGGDELAVRRADNVLSRLGTTIEMPSVRASAYLKLANNTVLGVFAETLGELLAMCNSAGVDHDLAVRTLTTTFARIPAQKAPLLLTGDSDPRFTLSALLKDLQLAQGAADSVHVKVPVLAAVLPEAERAVDQGLGDRDYIVLAMREAVSA